MLLPVKTVGVMGDGRTYYDYACALRAVTSTDGMTADVFPFPPEFLVQLATRIINKVPGINRVTYASPPNPLAPLSGSRGLRGIDGGRVVPYAVCSCWNSFNNPLTPHNPAQEN